ncbi:MAG: DUF3168 domain-containing protein [Comamonadaceae bacterium]
MSIGSLVYTALSGNTALAALVGERIFPVIAQAQIAYPYLVYSEVYNAPQNSLGGWSGCDNTRLQIDCWSKSYSNAHAVATLVRAAMASATTFKGVCINTLDGPVEGGLDLYHVIVEFSLWSV